MIKPGKEIQVLLLIENIEAASTNLSPEPGKE
jgi:hypothetical protein